MRRTLFGASCVGGRGIGASAGTSGVRGTDWWIGSRIASMALRGKQSEGPMTEVAAWRAEWEAMRPGLGYKDFDAEVERFVEKLLRLVAGGAAGPPLEPSAEAIEAAIQASGWGDDGDAVVASLRKPMAKILAAAYAVDSAAALLSLAPKETP